MNPVECDFCASQPSEVTVTRKAADGSVRVRLRLCRRCVDLQQYVTLLQARTPAAPTLPCFRCGQPARAECTCQGQGSEFVGRVGLCGPCVASPPGDLAAMLRVSTLWTPGVLELPPVAQRVFWPPPPPQDSAPPFSSN